MLSSVSANFLVAIANVVQLGEMLYKASETNPRGDRLFKLQQYQAISQGLAEIEKVADELGLDATKQAAIDSMSLLVRSIPQDGHVFLNGADAERLMWSIFSLRTNVLSQTYSRAFFVVDSKYATWLLSDEPPFGTEVDDAFPTAGEEISEAAKCLALERPTAVVFHLMRAMELAVTALADRLGKTVSNKTWGMMLSDIHQYIEGMPKGSERDAWSSVHAHLYHVKQAWRNDTMHPKTTYSEAQAATVFEAVKSFMIGLAPMIAETRLH